MLVVKYSLTFILIIVDLISFLISFNVGGISPTEVKEILDDEKKESNSWILMLPLLTEWLITLGFYIHLKRRKKTVKEKMKKLILEQKSNIKGYTKDRASQLRKTLKLMEKNYNHSYFEKFLFNVLLIIFPILLKLIILKSLGYKAVFCIVAVLFYGYDIVYELIHFFFKLRKRKKYNNELFIGNKDNIYKSLKVIVDNPNSSMNINEDNNLSIGEIEININNMNEHSIYQRNKKMKSKFGEIPLHIAFLFSKAILEILFIIYWTRIGEKLDDPNSSCSWTILFIPFYLILLAVLLFCVLHCLSLYRIFKEKVWIPILTVIPCLVAFIVFCVVIPLKLDKKISLHQAFIPTFFAIGTIFFIIHLILLRKYKNFER